MSELLDVALFVGDLAQFTSFLMVIVALMRRKSCQGWSGRTQILRFLVYLSRYWGLLSSTYYTTYHILSNICWIFLAALTLYLMYIRYRKTLDKKCDTFWIESIIIASLAAAFIFCTDAWSPEEILWLFSRFVESLSILPQYYFIFHKGEKEKIVTYYVVTLIYYRMFYVGHWMNIYVTCGYIDPFILYPGLIQLILYGVYFLIPKGKKHPSESLPQRILPKYLTQESLLETPLLKRSATASSSIYVIGCESNYSTLTRSVQSFGSGSTSDEGRY